MKRFAAVIATLVGIALVATVLLFTAGGVSLVSTRGASMQPHFRDGDLGVLRPAPEYSVGDVASYRSQQMRTVVMHRIIDVTDGRYTFQGDNNAWVDSEQPTRTQILGQLAFRVPHGGVWLDRATRPTAVAAAAFLLLISGGTTAAVTRRHQRRKPHAMKPAPLRPPLRHMPLSLRAALTMAGVIAITSLGLGVVTWTHASTPVAVQTTASPASTMTFSYRATVAPSAAYDSTTVTQPQPIFRRVAEEVAVGLLYERDTAVTDATMRITAELSTANGWRSTVPIGQLTTFTGSTYHASVPLDLDELQSRADAAAKEIGEPAGDVSLVVTPEVDAGDDEVFRPHLRFTLSPVALRLAEPKPTLVATSTGRTALEAAGVQPSLVSVLGRSIAASHARHAAAVGLAVAMVAAVVVAGLTRRANRAPHDVVIQARYAQALLAVDPMALPEGRPVVDVPHIDALIRLAERYGLFVMHWERGGTHTYVVLDDATTYRYRPAHEPAAAPEDQHAHGDNTVRTGN